MFASICTYFLVGAIPYHCMLGIKKKMTLKNPSVVRNVTGITDEEKQRIYDYLHGMVYSWCASNRDGWFSARDMLGNVNFNWSGTPLQVLYDKHINEGKNPKKAIKAAGKDAGWLLKHLIANDQRQFETRLYGFIRQYRWIS